MGWVPFQEMKKRVLSCVFLKNAPLMKKTHWVLLLFLKYHLWKERNIISVLPTCFIDIHSPESPTEEVMVSTAHPVTLALIHDGVIWRWSVPAEAFPSPLHSGIGVTLVLLHGINAWYKIVPYHTWYCLVLYFHRHSPHPPLCISWCTRSGCCISTCPDTLAANVVLCLSRTAHSRWSSILE